MDVTHIPDHVLQAKERLLQQYKGKPGIEAIISDFVVQAQELEDAFYEMLLENLDNAVGANLDGYGDIVGKARVVGQSDDDYRIQIKGQIIANVSFGEAEKVIQFFRILTGSMRVQVGDHSFGEVTLLADHPLTQNEVDQYFREVKRAIAAGVRVSGIGYFDPADSFALAGQDATGKGFGSVYDATVGGKLASIKRNLDVKFGFAGANSTMGGFGSVHDPLVGGVLVGAP